MNKYDLLLMQIELKIASMLDFIDNNGVYPVEETYIILHTLRDALKNNVIYEEKIEKMQKMLNFVSKN